jgi:hypothetical protein
MAAELEDREAKLRSGGTDGQETDQWRTYQFIVTELASDRPLRLMIQASAGTGLWTEKPATDIQPWALCADAPLRVF